MLNRYERYQGLRGPHTEADWCFGVHCNHEGLLARFLVFCCVCCIFLSCRKLAPVTHTMLNQPNPWPKPVWPALWHASHLKIHTLPRTAQLFYYLSSRNYLRCSQETRRCKRGLCLSALCVRLIGWDTAPFSWTSCWNCGHLMNSLFHDFFWTSPVFSCCCPLC